MCELFKPITPFIGAPTEPVAKKDRPLIFYVVPPRNKQLPAEHGPQTQARHRPLSIRFNPVELQASPEGGIPRTNLQRTYNEPRANPERTQSEPMMGPGQALDAGLGARPNG
jgi:hypothetical protein